METLCKCSQCETELNENDFCAYDLNGAPVCESCENSAWDYANTVVTVHGNDRNVYLWCDTFGFRNRDSYEEENPSGVDGFEYKRTDAWRGYWDVEIAHGYQAIATGWSTGDYTDVPWKKAFHQLTDAIAEGEAEPPVEVIFAMGLTSNVFSMSTDIIIRTCDLQRFTEWMSEEIGITVEALQNSLK